MTITNPFTRYYFPRDKFFIFVKKIINGKLSLKVETLSDEESVKVSCRKDIFDWVLNNPKIKKNVLSDWINPETNYINPDYRNLVSCSIRGRGHTIATTNHRGMANVYILSKDVYDIIKLQISPPSGYEDYSKEGVKFVGYYDRGELMFIADNDLIPSGTCIYCYSVNHNQIHESPFYVFYKNGEGYIKPMGDIHERIEVLKIDITEDEFNINRSRKPRKSINLVKMLMSGKLYLSN